MNWNEIKIKYNANVSCPITKTLEDKSVSYLEGELRSYVFTASDTYIVTSTRQPWMLRSWLTPDDQLGGGSNVVDGGLCRAGVASGVLQLGILDKQLAVWAATLHEARQQGDKHIKTRHNLKRGILVP